MKLFKKICRGLLIAAFWLTVWAIASYAFGKPLLFPSPLSVLAALWGMLGDATFYTAIATSVGNVFIGILSAMLCAILCVTLTYRFRILRDLLLPVMTVIKATPVASIIILMWLFLGAGKVPGLITLLIVLPVVWTNLDEGLGKIDPQLREVATVYRMPPIKRLRFLILPSVKPYFVSACRTSLGLAWKAGIAAEIIVRTPRSIGNQIATGKDYTEYVDVFTWTLVVILLSLIIELLFASLLKRLDKRSALGKEEK